MARVFFRSADPVDDAADARLIYTGHNVRYNAFGVLITPGGEIVTYSEPDTRSVQETTDLIPWHRVDHVEDYPGKGRS
jgi:hypothetical protein